MIKKIVLLFSIVLVVVEVAGAGGPENAVVVVNAESASSKLIANYYVFHRKIPANNVIYLDRIPNGETIELDECRENIIVPVFKTIEQRGLVNQIDYVIYSSGFPTAVRAYHLRDKLRATGDASAIHTANSKVLAPELSLTSATYFYQSIIAERYDYLSLSSNLYMRVETKKTLSRPFVGKEEILFQRALINARNDKFEEAVATLESMAEKHPMQMSVLYWLARIYAWESDAENATKWLTRCIDAGWSYRDYTKSDKAFDGLKNKIEFQSTVELIPDLPFRFIPTQSFSSRYNWAPNGLINSTRDQGKRYMLSTMLGVNRNQGNSEQETLRYLLRSIAADGSQPKGTIYITDPGEVRSKAREQNFTETVQELRALGIASEIVKRKMPMNRKDVAGLTMHAAEFDWRSSGSSILPGAFCDSLTSYAGRLMPETKQTKLTEFLRYGAAGSSGTVREPFAIQAKFPHPRIHVHYVRGCTLAESFYQSVAGPFQLLIVADALCKPWARNPKIKLSGDILDDQPLSGVMEVELDGQNSPVEIREVEIYLNGALVRRLQKTGADPFVVPLSIDTKTMPDGYHEFRFVPISAGPVATRGSVVAPIVVNNFDGQVELGVVSRSIDIDETITFSASAPDATEIKMMHNSRTLAKRPGPSATFKVPAYELGRGPVVLNAVATIGKLPVQSEPLVLDIQGPISTTIPIIKSPPTRKTKTRPARKKPRKK